MLDQIDQAVTDIESAWREQMMTGTVLFANDDDTLQYDAKERIKKAVAALRSVPSEIARPCTCHPDDNPPVPCPKKYALTECREAALSAIAPINAMLPEHGDIAGMLGKWVEAEKAKADAYEDAARVVERMAEGPEEGRRLTKEEEWACIKLEDAAKAIRERKAKQCHVTQAVANG